MASEGEIRAAIAKIRHNRNGATAREFQIVEEMAKQAGSFGDEARAALGGR